MIRANIRTHKKSYLLLAFVILFSVILELSAIIFTSSYELTKQEQRKDLYGAWHIALYGAGQDTCKDIRNHATIENVGQMTILGYASGNDDNFTGSVGTIDGEAIGLGHITLLDGAFPVKKDEIAIEMSHLTRLGYSYKLGQIIELTVRIPDKKDKDKKAFTQTVRSFKLCGVIKNYSNLWKTNNNDVVSFCVSNSLSEDFPPYRINLFAAAKEKYADKVDELYSITVGSAFVKNDYTYAMYSYGTKKTDGTFSAKSTSILVVALSVLIIVNILNVSLQQRKNSFILMRSIGAAKLQIAHLYCLEILYIVFLAVPAGIILGLGLPSGVYLILRRLFGNTVCLSIPFKSVLYAIGILVMGIAVTVVFELIRILEMPLRGKPELQVLKKFKRRRFKPLNTRHITSILGKASRGAGIISFVMAFITCFVFVITAYSANDEYYNYRWTKAAYNADYEYAFMIGRFQPFYHMPEDELSKIENTYGVEYVRAYRISPYYEIDWENRSQSHYANVAAEKIFKEYVDKERFTSGATYGTVIGLSPEKERDYLYYVNEIDEGSFSLKSFADGTGVILYLPAYYLLDNGLLLSQNDKVYELQRSSSKEIREDTINAGDKLIIHGSSQTVTVTVSAIIYGFEDNDAQSYLSRPYSIIGSYKLSDMLSGNGNATYEYIQVYGDSNINYLQTDVELSKIKTGLYLSNFRVKKENLLNQALLRAVNTLIINISIIMIMMLIQLGINENRSRADYERNRTFYILGMEKERIQKLYSMQTIRNSLVSAALSIGLLFGYKVWQCGVRHSELVASIFDLIRYTYFVYFKRINLLELTLFIFLYITINIITVQYPSCKMRKNSL